MCGLGIKFERRKRRRDGRLTRNEATALLRTIMTNKNDNIIQDEADEVIDRMQLQGRHGIVNDLLIGKPAASSSPPNQPKTEVSAAAGTTKADDVSVMAADEEIKRLQLQDRHGNVIYLSSGKLATSPPTDQPKKEVSAATGTTKGIKMTISSFLQRTTRSKPGAALHKSAKESIAPKARREGRQ